MITQLYGA